MNVFKNKNFTFLFCATLISNLGSNIFNFIIGWYILEKTGSVLQMGTFISIPYIIHILFSPFFGILCDKFDRKKIVVYTDIINAICMLLVFGVLVFEILSSIELFIFYLINIIICITDSLANIGTFTLKKECCNESEIKKCNTLFAIQSNFTTISGSVISGFLYYYIGMKYCILLNLLSYLISAFFENKICIMNIQINEHNSKQRILSDIKEGISYVRNRKDIMQIFVFAILFNSTLNPLIQVIMPYIFNTKGILVTNYSLVKSCLTFGSVFCSFYLLKKDSNLTLITFCSFFKWYIFTYLFYIVNYKLFNFNIFSYDIYILINYCIFFSIGIIVALFNIPFNNYIHLTVESHMMGRVFSLFNVASHSFTPAALIISSYLIKYNIDLVLILSIILIVLCYFKAEY